MSRLTIRLHKGMEREILRGFPWLYQGEFVESSDQVVAEPGELADIVTARGEFVATGYFNRHSQIACRILTRKREMIDAAWLEQMLRRAFQKRDALYPQPHYRAVHAEADGLPGLLVDRYGDILALQAGTAGIERLMPEILSALIRIAAPRAILAKNDAGAREAEGLPRETKILLGEIPERVTVIENACLYAVDLMRGQKTGWFFDQRDNRAWIAERAKGKTLLDVYSHSGGFGMLAAKEGASQVTMVDSSPLALELAREAAALNDVTAHCEIVQGDALMVMERFAREGARFDVVVADPPAFVKAKRDLVPGLKGYEKVARLAAALVAPGGILKVASCSHHASRQRFTDAVLAGVKKAGREGQVMAQLKAGRDHPVHPHLPQSEYLKAVALRISA